MLRQKAAPPVPRSSAIISAPKGLPVRIHDSCDTFNGQMMEADARRKADHRQSRSHSCDDHRRERKLKGKTLKKSRQRRHQKPSRANTSDREYHSRSGERHNGIRVENFRRSATSKSVSESYRGGHRHRRSVSARGGERHLPLRRSPRRSPRRSRSCRRQEEVRPLKYAYKSPSFATMNPASQSWPKMLAHNMGQFLPHTHFMQSWR